MAEPVATWAAAATLSSWLVTTARFELDDPAAKHSRPLGFTLFDAQGQKVRHLPRRELGQIQAVVRLRVAAVGLQEENT